MAPPTTREILLACSKEELVDLYQSVIDVLAAATSNMSVLAAQFEQLRSLYATQEAELIALRNRP